MASSSQKGIVITIPVLVLSVSAAAIFLFFLLSSLSSSPCTCPPSIPDSTLTTAAAVVTGGTVVEEVVDRRISTSRDDVEWVKDQIRANGLRMQDNVLRKGINPRTRAQQLEDLNK